MKEASVVQVHHATKRFGAVTAVSGVSFEAVAGRVTGLLGPNGSGKTTTLRILLGLQRAEVGYAHILGRPIADLDRPGTIIGASIDNAGFAPGRTCRNHLRMIAPLVRADDKRVDEVLEMVGLAEQSRRPVRGFSLGMRQRLALAAALLGSPRVLVLDEPANGLDPIGITWLRNTMTALAAAGTGVLVSSHMLAELDRVVEDVVLLHHGRVVFAGERDDLIVDRTAVAIAEGPRRRAIEALLTRVAAVQPLPDGRTWVAASPREVARALRDHGIDHGEAVVSPADLEAAFMARTTTSMAVAQ
ncbi:ATP-binding cassette domain-containing protein [Microbacterium sp. ZW T5_56]|uniref:ATP-binding cassette domain-containing protein n=1 Tax=Microbacterium sp. ZW T5_56 TaxID=3378081 RepID=UPI0038524BC4